MLFWSGVWHTLAKDCTQKVSDSCAHVREKASIASGGAPPIPSLLDTALTYLPQLFSVFAFISSLHGFVHPVVDARPFEVEYYWRVVV